MTQNLTTRRLRGVWVVRADGAVIAETRNAVELSEGDLPAVIFFPREDVAMAFLDRKEGTAEHPGKGAVTLFSVGTSGATIHDAAWSYEAPDEPVADLKDHIAFDEERITVEQL